MRILSFSKRWEKLSNPTFTTFRFPRKDKDWFAGEEVSIVLNPRRKGGGCKLGEAYVESTEPKLLKDISHEEAVADGFEDWFDMRDWFIQTYGVERIQDAPMNKLTLKKIGDH